jgi:hypothetical protein
LELPEPGGLRLHALFGGQGSIPGGTQALGQNATAMSLMFEHTDVYGGVGVAIRYLNEGFLGPQNEPWALTLKSPLHYRDAYSALLDYWWPLNKICRFAPALGPEMYFDTTAELLRRNYGDRHGVGLQSSILGQCDLTSRLSIEAAVTRSLTVASFDSTTVLLGLIFRPAPASEHDFVERIGAARRGRVEITAGRLDIDDFNVSHDDGTVTWVSYAHEVSAPYGLEISLLRERVASAFDRRGAALQLTLQHQLFVSRLQAFVGIGPYLARSTDLVSGAAATQANLLLAYGVRFVLARGCSLTVKLGRVAASSGRNDSDVVTAGFSADVP